MTREDAIMVAQSETLLQQRDRISELEEACRCGANAISFLRVAIDNLPGDLPQELQNAFVGSGPTQALLERMSAADG